MELIMASDTDYLRYQKALKRVAEIKSFYRHLFSSSIVMIGLIYINLKYTPEVLWFLWALLGTGIPIIIHAIKTFRWIPYFNENWEQKKIKQFMKEEKDNTTKFE